MHHTDQTNLWIKALILAFWAAVVAVGILSLLPVEALPSPLLNWWDKAQHALGFLVLATLGFAAFAKKTTLVAVWLAIYGMLIELAQAFTGWRYGDIMDWLSDLAGIALAMILLAVIQKYWPALFRV
ncbi:VanZ family protein [Hydrogenophaga sp. 5NK40-0174]|uniref:VanZ family protein n=1 Tax=Hydrogenophaga sp. 5NK40-0174 TaxID=3127649 RepID=UPI00310909EC